MKLATHSTRLWAGLFMMVGSGFFLHSYWIEGKAVVAQVLLNRAWNQTLKNGAPVKAWSWADTEPLAKIEMPRLEKSAIVLRSASGEAMAFGPGHVSASPMPGETGTSIIAAHRDTHFAFLKDVDVGDEIFVTGVKGLRERFEVTGSKVVRWDNSGIDPNAGDGRVALVTCYPFGGITGGPLRYVVFAQAKQRPKSS